jgi:glycerol uptake facilitator-like aquaporin
MRSSLGRALVAESIGTFALVFAGAGAVGEAGRSRSSARSSARRSVAYQFVRGEETV